MKKNPVISAAAAPFGLAVRGISIFRKKKRMGLLAHAYFENPSGTASSKQSRRRRRTRTVSKSDAIRCMTNAELAKFLKDMRDIPCYQLMNCFPENTFDMCKKYDMDCCSCIEEWLKTPCKRGELESIEKPSQLVKRV